MTEKPGIYAITCVSTGKVYVGSASNISKRWSRHRKDLRAGCHTNPHLQSAWKKHGEHGFVFSILELTDDLSSREQFWMDRMKCSDRRWGFNLCPTARSSRGRPPNPRPDAAKHITNDHRRQAIQTRRSNGTLGQKLTWNDACRIRERYGGESSRGGKGRKRGQVTVAQLAREYKVHPMTISDVLTGKTWRDKPVDREEVSH
jgi:group I intron endonuclease